MRVISHPVLVPNRYCDLDVARINLALECDAKLPPVEFTFPPSHHHACHAIAAEIRPRPGFAHELVDPEHDRHAWKQFRPDRSERPRESNESRPGDARGSLRCQHGNDQNRQLLPEGQIDIHRLRDEKRRQSHVDVGPVQVERVAGRNDQADHRLGAAEDLELLHELRKRAFGGRGAEHRIMCRTKSTDFISLTCLA